MYSLATWLSNTVRVESKLAEEARKTFRHATSKAQWDANNLPCDDLRRDPWVVGAVNAADGVTASNKRDHLVTTKK